MTAPKLIDRPAQPYVGIRAQVAPAALRGQIDQALPRLFGWLQQKRIQPAGAPFVKYDVVDMTRALEIELGVPTTAPVQADGEVHAGTLPAGRYAVSVHHGSPDGLRDANAALLGAAQQLGVAWDKTDTPRGERFAARLETYLTDPAEQPDSAQWETEIAIKTK